MGTGRVRSAFTLLEILLALALIALLAAVLVGGGTRLLDGRSASPEDVFWQACQAARKAALQSGREVRLSFDDRGKAFAVDDGATVKRFPLPAADAGLSVDFLPAQADNSAILLGGMMIETQGLAGATFYEDGTCSPFRVQFRGTSSAHILSIDPWTCAPMLVPSQS